MDSTSTGSGADHAANQAPGNPDGLEPLLGAVESRLEALGEALRRRDAQAIDTESSELHRALVHALDGFSAAARKGPVPTTLRSRLARASGQVVVHRECLARATAALDRAVDALMPRDAGGGLYTAQGSGARSTHLGSGSVRA